MNPPWMPLNIADYLRDTTHLRALESGAYLHLIMGYWVAAGLPNDDRQLATIAKLTDKEWKTAKPLLAPFFGPNWSSHKRIDKELAKATEISSKRRASAQQRYSKQPASDPANADAKAHTEHITHSEPKGSAPPIDQKTDLFRRAKEILGPQSGGLVAKLLRANGGEDAKESIPKSRAAVEMAFARTGGDPERAREYIGRVLAPKTASDFKLMSGMEGVI